MPAPAETHSDSQSLGNVKSGPWPFYDETKSVPSPERSRHGRPSSSAFVAKLKRQGSREAPFAGMKRVGKEPGHSDLAERALGHASKEKALQRVKRTWRLEGVGAYLSKLRRITPLFSKNDNPLTLSRRKVRLQNAFSPRHQICVSLESCSYRLSSAHRLRKTTPGLQRRPVYTRDQQATGSGPQHYTLNPHKKEEPSSSRFR